MSGSLLKLATLLKISIETKKNKSCIRIQSISMVKKDMLNSTQKKNWSRQKWWQRWTKRCTS